MKRNVTERVATRAVARALGFAIGVLLCVAPACGQFSDLSFAIEESGPASSPQWKLQIGRFNTFRPFSIVAPNGAALPVAPGSSQIAFDFSSLNNVYSFLQGEWAYTTWDPFNPAGVTTFGFRFEDLADATPDRSLPESLNLTEGAILKNGREFLLAWDYPTTGGSPTRSLVRWSPLFDGVASGYTSRVVSPPSPNGSSSGYWTIGVGDEAFTTRYRNEPGASTNRWLYTLSAATPALPLEVEFTLGAYTSLNNHVWTQGTTGSGDFDVSLSYLRLADRFNVTLSTVPEPVTLAMATIALAAIAVRRRVEDC